MLNRERLDEAIAALVPDAAEVDGWFICGPGPMMDAAEGALLDRNIAKERIHIERFTADRPAGAVAREIAELQTKAEGRQRCGDARRAHPPRAVHRRQYPRQCARVRPSRAVRVQGGRVRDLPRQSHQRARSRWPRATASPTRRSRPVMC